MAKREGSGSCGLFIVMFTVIVFISEVPFFALCAKIWTQGNEAKCDIFSGEWVPNPSGPPYTTCICIYTTNACLKNGRPDTGYLYWRWKPYGCDLPPLDAERFMESMKDRSWAFIGDSLVRNQMESLVCMLSKIEVPQETCRDETFDYKTYYFSSNNLTMATVRAPFLVKYKQDDDGKEIQVHLDILDEIWTDDYRKYDYYVIASGQWYTKEVVYWEEGKIIGCHNCMEKDIKDISIGDAYRKGLQKTFDFITSSDHKPLVFFRTWMPNHFENGGWYDGGTCNKTRPYRDGEYDGTLFERKMWSLEVDEFEKVAKVASKKGIRVELLDTFHLTSLRPDGHPGPYANYHPFDKDKHARVKTDCLHLCLPGPVDTWNDLLMMIMVSDGTLKSSAYEKIFAI